ncbi:MAG: hypothetical protein HQK53_12575 [Oligoflexia bacterium]|nr:hypothetical protein [Oligoflexia bacterium]
MRDTLVKLSGDGHYCTLIMTLIILATTSIYNAVASNPTEHFLSPQDFSISASGLPSIFIINKEWNPEESLFAGQINCSAKKCITITEAVNAAITNGLPTRERYESVFRARQTVVARLGNILPRFELSLGYGMNPLSILNFVGNLLGFLMPSNWYNWKESKLMHLAEVSSFQSLLQDQVSNTEILYYNIHRINFDLLIYEYYIERLESFISDLRSIATITTVVPSTSNPAPVPEADMLILENYLAEIKSAKIYLDGVIRELDEYDIAIAMNYPNMSEVGLKPLVLPDLSKNPHYTISDTDIKRIKNKSKTLLALRYMRQAAHYARKSRTWAFLGTGGSGSESSIGISFGLDNIANVRIARSEERSVDILITQTKYDIENIFRKAVDSYNSSIDLYKQYTDGKVPNRALFRTVLNQYNREGKLMSEQLIRAIDWALKFELGRNFVQHFYLTAHSQMQRLLVQGKLYERLAEETNIPETPFLSRLHNWDLRRENDDINRAIRRGYLDLENP